MPILPVAIAFLSLFKAFWNQQLLVDHTLWPTVSTCPGSRGRWSQFTGNQCGVSKRRWGVNVRGQSQNRRSQESSAPAAPHTHTHTGGNQVHTWNLKYWDYSSSIVCLLICKKKIQSWVWRSPVREQIGNISNIYWFQLPTSEDLLLFLLEIVFALEFLVRKTILNSREKVGENK